MGGYCDGIALGVKGQGREAREQRRGTSRQANGLSNTESCGEGNGNGDGGSLGIPAW